MPLLLPEGSNCSVRAERVDAGRIAWVQGAGPRWALLADLHLSVDPMAEYDGIRTLDNCARAVEQIRAAGVEGVLANGDLAWNTGERGDYERVAETLAPLARQTPVTLMPGNHDRRDRLLQRFHPEAYSLNEPAKVITVIDTPHARLIALDSLYRTDVVPGLLGQAQRHWLASALDAEPDRPTMLFVHHPLGEDDGALLDGPRLLHILESRPQVKAVFTAHDHIWRLESLGRLPIIKLPAAGFPFLPAERSGWVEMDLREDSALLRFYFVGGCEEQNLQWRP